MKHPRNSHHSQGKNAQAHTFTENALPSSHIFHRAFYRAPEQCKQGVSNGGMVLTGKELLMAQ